MKLFSPKQSEVELTISNQTVVRVLTLVAVAVVAFLAVSRSLNTLVIIGTAFFLSVALNAPVRWLSEHLPGKRRGSRSLATTISVLIIVLALVGFLWALVPPILKQVTNFVSSAPELIQSAQDQNSPVGRFIRDNNLESQVDKLTGQLSDKLGDIGSSAVSTLSKIGSSIFTVLSVIVLTIMMLLEGPRWTALAYRLIPERRRGHTQKLVHDMLGVVQGYVNGQVTLAAIAAVLIVPVFFIVGVNYPIALMFVVFVCGLIPMVGHTIGAVICTLVALFTSWPAALIVLGYYILYQQIENYAVQPKIQANSTNMSPLLVFVSVLLGANFGGLLGALVAIPVMGCVRILLLDYLERRDILAPVAVPAPARPLKKKLVK